MINHFPHIKNNRKVYPGMVNGRRGATPIHRRDVVAFLDDTLEKLAYLRDYAGPEMPPHFDRFEIYVRKCRRAKFVGEHFRRLEWELQQPLGHQILATAKARSTALKPQYLEAAE